MKKISAIGCMFLLACLLTGCSFWDTLSASNIGAAAENKISRSSFYWSGVQIGTKITVNEGEEISFDMDMEKGSVTFILKDDQGNDVYSLEKEGEYSGTEIYTAEKSETLWLTEKGKHFKGAYKIEWGKPEDSEDADSDTDEESENETEQTFEENESDYAAYVNVNDFDA